MTEQTQDLANLESQENADAASSINPQDELNALKERAKLMGISFSGNIGVDALRQRVNDKLNGVVTTADATPVAVAQVAAVEPVLVVREKSKAEKEQDLRTQLVRDSMALVRCRIFNMNPTKRDLHGEIITVANRFIGTVRKFIPYGEATDKGYHIPKVLYDDLVSRVFQEIKTKTVNGQIKVITRMAPEFNIQILVDLTVDELKDLSERQQAAERLTAGE